MNFIVIVCDTLRRDFLGCYGNNWIKTPYIDKFARQSIIFDNAYSASFPTVPARRDIFTGKYSFTYSEWRPLENNEVVLAEVLGKAGYITMFIADTPHFVRDGYNFQRGFYAWEWIRGQENDFYSSDWIDVKLLCKKEKLRDPEHTMKRYSQNISLRRYEEDYFVAQTMGKAMKWLERNYKHNKFFLYVDTFDPHEPWDPPEWYVNRYDPNYNGEEVIYPRYWYWKKFLTEKELKHCRALYAGEVSLVDHWVGKLIEKVWTLGIEKDTAIILTTDHGFSHGEHGIIGKALIEQTKNKTTFSYMPLYEEINHIPFIIYLPSVKRAMRIKSFIQLTDIMPTLLDLAKIKPESEMHGKSIIPLIKGNIRKIREFTIGSPTIIHATEGNVRTTITTDNGWSLILAGKQNTENKKYSTSAVDGLSKNTVEIGNYQTELYNLKTDPKQQKNLFSKYPEIVEQIKNKYIAKLRELKTSDEFISIWE